MAKLVHSMIRVVEEARSLAFYDKAFGLKLIERIDFADFTLVYLATATGEFELELTVNKGRAEPYELGTGYGHLAVVVDNLDAEYARFIAEGLTVGKLVDFKNGDTPVGRFFFATDPDGYKIEVIEKGGRFK
ncbi:MULTISPECIES: VOC family protein [unclassified Devosia]|uniref:VOC family protein n=1 Tax=unclassified Devosia TaxID=196773 RepID=UPI00145CDCDE|nr:MULTISPECIES: VOC family protein [unclassified Devosia]MBJ6988321.1 VOC family protein [Devosia sp. MC521]MBJ7579049.1 VOC family protein [Devosia sp. MC532]MBK1795897.1 VOC family protein [Devosia sp. WQ 349K1]QMW63061.1 VOC family protein [Devosia sp. MC521]